MPVRTRLLCTGLGLIQRTPLADLSPQELDRRRSLTPRSGPPASWVTGPLAPSVRISTLQVPVRDGATVAARVHRPSTVGDRVLLWLHGGGWTLGRPRDYDSMAGLCAQQTGCVVVVPDYRLAPEHKAPTAVHDTIDVLDWLASGPTELGIGVPSVAVAGDSAGGNLAALAALHARDTGLALTGQALVYPSTDLAAVRPYRDAPVLSGEDMDTFKAFYLGGSGLPGTDPTVSPAHAPSHEGLAPALVQTAELDPLRPEGEKYAEILERAGVPTRYTCYRGVPHGYLSMPGATHVGYQARWEIVDALGRWWA